MLFVGFGHSVLAMSGEETLAQVNREIEHPKLKNLEKTGLVIFIYSLLFTSLVSFFAVMIIPDSVRPGLLRQPDRRHRHVSGRAHQLKLLFPRLRRAGGCADSGGRAEYFHRRRERRSEPRRRRRRAHHWFQKPHNRYGTSYRIINLIVGCSCSPSSSAAAMSMSGGALRLRSDLELRHEVAGRAGAALHRAGNRQWKVPGNLHIGKTEIPLGLIVISAVLFMTAIVNLFTKVSGDNRRSDLQRRSFSPSSRFPSITSPKSGTASRNNSTSSASTAIRNWAAGRWACARATSWLRCATPQSLLPAAHPGHTNTTSRM
jgi:hypothetical protein